MFAISARVSTKYQVVIPKAVREALHLQPNEPVLFLVDDGAVILRAKPRSFTKALLGLYADSWPNPDEWLERERASWE